MTAVLALVFNAFVWGVSWWPFRQLEALGLHPLWTTVAIFGLSLLVITLARPAAWRELARARGLWWLVAAAGTTNATFNWGVTAGDVVRVVLLFYLMPLWAAVLARVLLGEALTGAALLRAALAMAGAATVLWPAQGGFPVPRELPDWLGLAGGFSFALNNVLLRRERNASGGARALAMFLGGVLMAGLLALALSVHGSVAPPPPPRPAWVLGALAMGLVFVGSNLALQYGASRLPANTTSIVMLSEILFASASALALGGGSLTPQVALGGALIMAAAFLAARPGAAPG